MGNQICCEDNRPKQADNELTIVVKHEEQPIQIPEISEPIKEYLEKEKPMSEYLPSNPERRQYGEDIFEGSIDEKGRPDGYGKMYKKNGGLFVGRFEQGIAQGQGHYIKPDGQFYHGLFENNKANDANGHYKNQKFEYKGGFKDNIFHGEAYETSPKHTFKGTYDEGKKIHGLMKWYDQGNKQVVYEGPFNAHGKPHGQGRMVHQKGQYEGTFIDGEKHGKGIFKFKNQLQYVGQYNHNLRDGYGKIINPSGEIAYEGHFTNGLPNGKGKTQKDGKMIEAQWDNGIDIIRL